VVENVLHAVGAMGRGARLEVGVGGEIDLCGIGSVAI
jgi:hypothetical protein